MHTFTGSFDVFFFLGSMPLFNLKIWPKCNTETVCKSNTSKTAQKKLCSWIDEHISGISQNYAPKKPTNLAKIKYATETLCQRNSSKNTYRISGNFVVMKDILCRCAYSQEILIQYTFWEKCLFWTYKFG